MMFSRLLSRSKSLIKCTRSCSIQYHWSPLSSAVLVIGLANWLTDEYKVASDVEMGAYFLGYRAYQSAFGLIIDPLIPAFVSGHAPNQTFAQKQVQPTRIQ